LRFQIEKFSKMLYATSCSLSLENENLRKALSLFLVLVFLATLAIPLASVKAPTIREVTFYLYYGTAVGGGTDQYDLFRYDGVHWSTSKLPVLYYVNPKSSGVSSAETVAAIKASFEAWDAAVDVHYAEWEQAGYHVGVELYNDNVQTTRLSGAKRNGKNIVSWGTLGTGILARTTYWYYTTTLEIVEFDIVFNKLYAWGIDPDGEGGTTISAFDIQNIGTHEAGHTLCIRDLYNSPSSELTMYGYGSLGEVKKRSLGYGDIHGAQYIYCGAYAPLIGSTEP